MQFSQQVDPCFHRVGNHLCVKNYPLPLVSRTGSALSFLPRRERGTARKKFPLHAHIDQGKQRKAAHDTRIPTALLFRPDRQAPTAGRPPPVLRLLPLPQAACTTSLRPHPGLETLPSPSLQAAQLRHSLPEITPPILGPAAVQAFPLRPQEVKILSS